MPFGTFDERYGSLKQKNKCWKKCLVKFSQNNLSWSYVSGVVQIGSVLTEFKWSICYTLILLSITLLVTGSAEELLILNGNMVQF